MRRFMIYTGFILLLLLGSVGQVQALTKIDTTPSWNGADFISSFGWPDTATYGQLITVPISDTALESFSFYMNLPDTVTFRGYVYAWDVTNSRATGPALYESPTMVTAGNGNFERVEFKTGGIPLTPGGKYVLFASVSKLSGSGYGNWGNVPDRAYTGGNFVYLNNGTDESKWTSTAWSTYLTIDLAFTATFGTPTQKILYCNDAVLGTDYVKEALANVGQTYGTATTIASNWADFETKIGAGGWDLVVLMNLGSAPPATPNFNAYVSGGGRAILTDYSRNAARAALFGATYTTFTNRTAFAISDDLLSSGVENPVILVNPGWPGMYSFGMTATTGTAAATFPNGNAAIIMGSNERTIINGFLTDTIVSDGAALFGNEILTVLPLKVANPNGGEKVPAGSLHNLAWIPGTAVSFDVDLSTNKGSGWKPIVKQYGESVLEWRVPLQKDNMPLCKIRVTGYDANGVKVAQDTSDNLFTIEVVKLTEPNGGEAWTSHAAQTIRWTANGTMGTVASVQLFYTLDGKKWKTIATVAGNPGTYSWTVPTVTATTQKCKVKAVLKNADAGKGKTLGTAISEGYFTINP